MKSTFHLDAEKALRTHAAYLLPLFLMATTAIGQKAIADQVPVGSVQVWPSARGDESLAIDGDIGTYTWSTLSWTEADPFYFGFDLGTTPANVNHIRLYKDRYDGYNPGAGHPDPLHAKDLIIQYTTDTGSLDSRTWSNVSNLLNGFNGTELMTADAVNSDGTVDFDHHNSTTEGWASLTFDTTAMTGIRFVVMTTNDFLNHYKLHEFEAHLSEVQMVPTHTADAGADQVVNEGAHVTLDGSASSDPDGGPLTFHWAQIAGPAVSLSNPNAVEPTFTAPYVSPEGGTLTFELVVHDGTEYSDPDFVNVTVVNVNQAPVPDAGPDQTVNELAEVVLDGSASYDPDGEVIEFGWMQIGGPTVFLIDDQTATPSFTAPAVGSGGAMLEFEMFISDGIGITSDTVIVTVGNVNHAPVADAGSTQAADEATVVALDGTGSSDPDGDPLTYQWTQVSGPAVTLDDFTPSMPTFTAPDVAFGDTATLTFELVVNDGELSSAASQVTVLVRDTTAPPVCDFAEARIVYDNGSLSRDNVMWPPNHKMHEIRIIGVSDPEDRDITIEILQVTQDEPLNGDDDGDTDEDAVVQVDGRLLLRAERSGSGNGRAYTIHFLAINIDGAWCDGEVTVMAPLSKRSGAVDDGPLFVSWEE